MRYHFSLFPEGGKILSCRLFWCARHATIAFSLHEPPDTELYVWWRGGMTGVPCLLLDSHRNSRLFFRVEDFSFDGLFDNSLNRLTHWSFRSFSRAVEIVRPLVVNSFPVPISPRISTVGGVYVNLDTFFVICYCLSWNGQQARSSVSNIFFRSREARLRLIPYFFTSVTIHCRKRLPMASDAQGIRKSVGCVPLFRRRVIARNRGNMTRNSTNGGML